MRSIARVLLVVSTLSGGLLVTAGPAAAATSAIEGPLAITQPRCQVKGLNAHAASSNSGTLTGGDYTYVVTVSTAGGEASPACPGVTVSVAGGTAGNSVVLEWTRVPEATQYTVYRGTGATAPTNLTAVPTGNCGLTSPDTCVFLDTGSGAVGATSPAAAPTADVTSGHHSDLTITERLDYGGDPSTATDDPFTNDPTAVAPASLKTDVVQLPGGLGFNASAAATCPLTGAGSLLGDASTAGSADADEDTCPLATLVGDAQVAVRRASGTRVDAADVYMGATKGSEAARLFIVVRPECSAGSAFAPGSAACNAELGTTGLQFEKLFLAAVVTKTTRDGAAAYNLSIRQAADDSTIPAVLTVLDSTGSAVGKASIQIGELALRLYGVAQHGTLVTTDDKPLLTLPRTCGKKSVVVQMSSYDATTPVSAGRSFSPTTCAPKVTLSVSKTTSKILASGTVTPHQSGVAMGVTLYRRHNGSYHALTTHHPAVSSTGTYGTSFTRPAAGDCKITSRYPGDATHLASSVSKTFRC